MHRETTTTAISNVAVMSVAYHWNARTLANYEYRLGIVTFLNLHSQTLIELKKN